MNLFSEIKRKLSEHNIVCTDSWNNRDIYNKGNLLLFEHNGTFYCNNFGSESFCYDYPIDSIERLEQLIKVCENLDFCENNPKEVTMYEFQQCVAELEDIRKNWNSIINLCN